MGAYLDSLTAAHAQRLARMSQKDDRARKSAVRPGAGKPACRPSIPSSHEIVGVVARLETLERQLAELLDSLPRPEDADPAAPAASPEAAAEPRVSDVKSLVCRCYGFTDGDLEGRSGRVAVVRARQIAIYLARQLTGKSFAAIARGFGDRDHATVLRACNRIERLRSADVELDRDLETLAALIRSQLAGAAAPEPAIAECLPKMPSSAKHRRSGAA